MNEANRQLFWENAGIHIPAEYEEIAGVKNTSTSNGAYINTHLRLIEKSCKIEGYALLQYTSGDWHVVCGGETADNSDDSIKIRRRANLASMTCSIGDDITSIAISYDKWFYFCIDHGTFTIDDQSLQYVPHEQLSPEIYIGNQNLNGKPYGGRFWSGAIGALKFWNESKLVGHFIPTKRRSDNVCGFYDIVTKQFMSSLTTTNFTEWTDSL